MLAQALPVLNVTNRAFAIQIDVEYHRDMVIPQRLSIFSEPSHCFSIQSLYAPRFGSRYQDDPVRSRFWQRLSERRFHRLCKQTGAPEGYCEKHNGYYWSFHWIRSQAFKSAWTAWDLR